MEILKLLNPNQFIKWIFYEKHVMQLEKTLNKMDAFMQTCITFALCIYLFISIIAKNNATLHTCTVYISTLQVSVTSSLYYSIHVLTIAKNIHIHTYNKVYRYINRHM